MELASKTHRGSVLIVEPDLKARERLCARISARLSRPVFAAGNADEALELLGKHEFDLIISERKLSGQSGTTILNEVMKRGFVVPFIFFTGSDFSRSDLRIYDYPVEIIHKPNEGDLLSVVGLLLGCDPLPKAGT